MERRAKIMATLGPASSSEEVIARLLAAGLDIVRLNLSHGSQADHRRTIERVRRLAGEAGREVPIVLDLMGPRYRLGVLPEDGPRQLEAGATVRLVAGDAAGGPDELPLGQPELLEHLEVGERVLIDGGLVELEATERLAGGGFAARVVDGGAVSSRKGINLPDTSLPFTISEKDRADLAFAVEEDVDYLAASYVHRAADLDELRREIAERGGNLPLIAKLERAGSIERLDELVATADALMVARGDLGVEVPLHQVPVLQKRIIDASRASGKPVIVATQMLESMMERPRPTRAETSDVANAVLDGADALMLSGETAAGEHPVKVVEVMDRVIREAEEYRSRRAGRSRGVELEPVALADEDEQARLLAIAEVVSAAAVYAAGTLGVRRIVAFSQGGFTARMIAKNRPDAPILVFTTDPRTARRVQLYWGVRPALMEAELEHHDEVVTLVERRLLDDRLASPGETIVILMGDPLRERALTNLMRVHRISS